MGAGALTLGTYLRVAFRRRHFWPGLLPPPAVWTDVQAARPRRRRCVVCGTRVEHWGARYCDMHINRRAFADWARRGRLVAVAVLTACGAPRAPAVSAAPPDSTSLFWRTQQVADVCLRALRLGDSLDATRQQQRHAVQRAPQRGPDSGRVRDSLRNLRWSSP